MTPDEQAVLRPELHKTVPDADQTFQPRPNVILETGMALATDDARTILVSTGPLTRAVRPRRQAHFERFT